MTYSALDNLIFPSDLEALSALCTLEDLLPEPPRVTVRPGRKPKTRQD